MTVIEEEQDEIEKIGNKCGNEKNDRKQTNWGKK